MREYGHENRGLTSYISWGLMLGARGTVALFRRFFGAVFHLRDLAKAYGTELGDRLRAEQDLAFMLFAARTGVPAARLRAAIDLQVAPIGKTPRGVLASVMLDRLAVVVLVVPLLLGVVWGHAYLAGYALPAVVALLAVWIVLHVLLSRGRPDVDPAALMGARAVELARLFPVSFVVMGHTHVPMAKAVGGSIYVNLGSWAEEEPDPADKKPYRAARTHLVIHATADGHQAHLCEWRGGEGPCAIHALVPPVASCGDGGFAEQDSAPPRPLVAT
jgi:hypothetical protein